MYEAAPVEDPVALHVLACLALHADTDGTGAFPAQSTIARWARASERAVRGKLVQLEAAGLIVRGDVERAAALPANHRPIVWDIPALSTVQGGTSRRPVENQGGTTFPPDLDMGGKPRTAPTSRGENPAARHDVPPISNTPPRVTSGGEGTETRAKRFPTQCDRHQDGPHDAPCHACGAARRAVAELEAAHATNAERERRERAAAARAAKLEADRAAIAACHRCDTVGRTTSGRICHHTDPAPPEAAAAAIAAVRAARQHAKETP